MKVSIIIPVYNTALKYLDQCFKSIKKQSEQDLEVIIIDDGSEQNIADYLDKWSNRDHRFQVFHTPNNGVSAARNRGIKESSGEWLTFIDADDYVETNMIKTVLDIAETSCSDIVMWRFDRDYNGSLRETNYVGKHELVFENKEIEKIERMLLNYYKYSKKMQFPFLPTTYCKLYKTDKIKDNNILFCENVGNGEDAIFTLEAVHFAKKIFFKNAILYHYRQWDGSASKSYSPTVIDSWIQNRKELKCVLEKMNAFVNYEDDYNYHALEVLKILLFTVIIKADKKSQRFQALEKLMSEEVFGMSIDNLGFDNVYGMKGKIILFLAQKRKYSLMLFMTKIRSWMTREDLTG